MSTRQKIAGLSTLQSLTWREAKEEIDRNPLALVPTGSTEQHGLHTPLGTDSIIAEYFAYKVSEKKNIICTPTVTAGVSDFYWQFPGTLWVSSETFKAYMREIVNSLHLHGINRVVMVNAHGGNVGCLRQLARQLRREKGIYTIVWTWMEAVKDEIIKLFGEPMPPIHADCVETSVLWAINENFVRKELLKTSSESASPSWAEYYNEILVSEETIDVSKNGATGDPTKADPEKGKILIQKAELNLISIIDWLQNKPVTALGSKPHK